MKNDVEYTLLELIEAPKRVNNITVDKLLDYILMAKEEESRFEMFIQMLYINHPWAMTGFCIMASDIINFKELFKEEIADLRKYQEGKRPNKASAGNVQAYWKMFLNYFQRGYIYSERNRKYLIHYIGDALSIDEQNFVLACIEQTYKKELFPMFKKLFSEKKLPENILEYFKCGINRIADTANKVGNICYSIDSYNTYRRFGSVYFDEDGLLIKDKEIYTTIDDFINKTSLPALGNRAIRYPFSCEICVKNKNNLFMVRTYEKTFLVQQPEKIDDGVLTSKICSGINNLIFSDAYGTVYSIISTNNKLISEKEITVKSIKHIKIPFIIMGTSVDCMLITSGGGEDTKDSKEFTALVPINSNIKIKKDEKIKFRFCNDVAFAMI